MPIACSEWIPKTAPGSLARLYSEHHTTFRQALEESGRAQPREDTVEPVEGGVRICTGSMCRTYTDAAAQDGLLTSFTTDDEPLAGHIVQPGAQTSAASVTLELVSGYETSRRALFLCVRATNGATAPVLLNAGAATYSGPDDQVSSAAEVPGFRGPLAPGATGVVCPVFEVGQPGGVLRVEFTSDPDSGTSPTPLELPVAAAPG